ncbi:MAG: LamG domain-containing protein [Verrucomicrobia bacterium]|nr:LamG domain-containing protein [Verrucomicrobiota bacterium]
MTHRFPYLWHHGLLAATALWLAGPGPIPQLEAAAPPGLITKDKVRALEGVFRGGSNFTPDRGGRTGNAGDRAADLSPGNRGPVYVANGGFLNEASANDEMSFAIWIKKTDTAPTGNSVFWGVSPSSNNGSRGWQVHLPWSDSNIYFDTSGCCEADLRRINASIETFPYYSFDYSWWQDWHFFVFSKKAATKQIWIDGELFLEGENTAPLPTDFTELFLGSDSAGASVFNGLIDDFSIYGTALTQAQINQLKSGTAPHRPPHHRQAARLLGFQRLPHLGLPGLPQPRPRCHWRPPRPHRDRLGPGHTRLGPELGDPQGGRRDRDPHLHGERRPVDHPLCSKSHVRCPVHPHGGAHLPPGRWWVGHV